VSRDRILLFLTLAIVYLSGLRMLPSAISAVPVVPDLPAATASNATTDTTNSVASEVRGAVQAPEPDTENDRLDRDALKQVCSLLGQPVEACVPTMIQLAQDDPVYRGLRRRGF
jgi:hypothetical protein